MIGDVQVPMASSGSATLVMLSRLMRLSEMSRKKRSTERRKACGCRSCRRSDAAPNNRRGSLVVILELVTHRNNGDVRFILDLEQSDIA